MIKRASNITTIKIGQVPGNNKKQLKKMDNPLNNKNEEKRNSLNLKIQFYIVKLFWPFHMDLVGIIFCDQTGIKQFSSSSGNCFRA